MLKMSLPWTLRKFTSSSVLYYVAALATTCCAQINDDNHYSEEDDAQVLPIVLPIVLVVVIICIVACCWQGKKCPCNKDDKKEKKKKESEEAEDADKVFVENEKSKASKMSSLASRQAALNRPKPPKYSTSSHTASVNNNRQRDLPGRTYGGHREQTSIPAGNKSYNQQSRKQQPPRSHTTSGYETGENTGTRRVDEKYKVVDNRSYNRESRSRYGQDNDGYLADGAGDSYRYPHKHDQYYRGDQRNGHY